FSSPLQIMEFADVIRIPKLDSVLLHRPLSSGPIDGTLCITGHHLIFSSRKETEEELWLLHRCVDAVEKRPGPNGGTLVLRCKDLRVISLEIPGLEEFGSIGNTIDILSNIEDTRLHYPFFYRAMHAILEDGWMAFLLDSEFPKLTRHSDDWRISAVNRDFQVCPSYSSMVVVPRAIEDEALIASAAFRQGGRFPVLSYRHSNGACLLRCSQPLVGPSGRRCKEDERLLNAVITQTLRGYVVDTRSQASAQAARGKGGGYEMETYYPQWKRIHKPLDRISSLLDSLVKLMDACNDTGSSMDKWLSRFESSVWLSQIREVLNTACVVAQCLDQEGASVVVHGTEGLDTTLQVTSLTQLLLDPDCRTIRGHLWSVNGFWVDIHSECVILIAAMPPQHCVHEGMLPSSFSSLIVFGRFIPNIPAASNSMRISFSSSLSMPMPHPLARTFMCNNEAELVELRVKERTMSIWSHVNRPQVLEGFLNPLYDPNCAVLWPSVAPMSLTLWQGLYLRWVVDMSPEMEKWKGIGKLKERQMELRSLANRLRSQLTELEREAVDLDLISPGNPSTLP
ncbi:unnamed protein product, partial [Darwinula stevensoni]